MPNNKPHNSDRGELLQNSFTAPIIMLQLASPIVGNLVVPLGPQLNDLKSRQEQKFYPEPTLPPFHHTQLALLALKLLSLPELLDANLGGSLSPVFAYL